MARDTLVSEQVSDALFDTGEDDRGRFRRRMLERVLMYMEDPSEGLGDEHAEYLLQHLCILDITGAMQAWQVKS